MVKSLPAMWKTQVRSLGWEDPLEKEMTTHSSILVRKIPWMEEPGRLQSIELWRVRHHWATSLSFSSGVGIQSLCNVKNVFSSSLANSRHDMFPSAIKMFTNQFSNIHKAFAYVITGIILDNKMNTESSQRISDFTIEIKWDFKLTTFQEEKKKTYFF